MLWIDSGISIRGVIREGSRNTRAIDRGTSEFPDRVAQSVLRASTTAHGLSEAVHGDHKGAAKNAAGAVASSTVLTLLVGSLVNAMLDYRLPVTLYPVLLMATSGWWIHVSTVISNRPSLVEPTPRRSSEDFPAVPHPYTPRRSTVIEDTLTRVGRMVGAAGTILLLLVSTVPAVLPSLVGLLPEAVPSVPALLDLALAGIVILAGLTAPFRFLASTIARSLVQAVGLVLASVVARSVAPDVAWLVPAAGLLLITTGAALRMLYSVYGMLAELRRWLAGTAPPS